MLKENNVLINKPLDTEKLIIIKPIIHAMIFAKDKVVNRANNEIINNNTLNILYDNIINFPSINIMLNIKYPNGPYADPEKYSLKLYKFKLFFRFNASKTALDS